MNGAGQVSRIRWIGALSATVLAVGMGTAQAAPSAAAQPAAAPAAAPPPTGQPAPQSAAQNEAEAAERFKRGLQLFDEGDYTLALVEFERAYQLTPNYRALYNIALVNMQLGRYADAARKLRQYLADGGDAIPAARRAEVAKSLNELRLRTATVDISTSTPSAEVMLDGKPLDVAQLHGPMLIDAGEHTLRATAAGYQSATRTLTLAGADHVAVRLDLTALAGPPHPGSDTPTHHNVFWPGIVATGAFAAGAIVSGVVVLDERSRLNQLQNTPGSDAGQRQSAANSVNSAALAADIFTGLAAVAGGVTLYLWLRPESPKGPSLAVSPQRIVLTGSF